MCRVAGPDHLPDLLRDPGDARGPGPLPTSGDPFALGLEDDHIGEKEETNGRIRVAEAAIERLDELAGEDWGREDTTERVCNLYNYRRNRFASRIEGGPDGVEERSSAYQRLMLELLGAQRRTLVRLRDEGKIGDEAMHRIERDLDLEESRLEV